MHERQVGLDKVKGHFRLPLGLRLFERNPNDGESLLTVSTVQLDGAHLEDPLCIVDAETGFETMVFFEGCSFFSLHTRHYTTRRKAQAGHRKVIEEMMAGTLPLAIRLAYYRAWDVERPTIAA